ncbi:hypothetical protein [Streptomyces sp. NPDC056987]|uniref:hypothetical protein n=1 Tax=Streptomyces sp. NPDC056987 TaxID=3345988 RepID=UPI003635799F
MPPTTQDGLPGLALPFQDLRPTITEQLKAFDMQHPWGYRALVQLVGQRRAQGCAAGRDEGPVRGPALAPPARRLLAEHPQWTSVIEVRRRRAP